MRDLALIVHAEQRTLLKGFIFSFLVALPFTFLPTIFKYGLTVTSIVSRLPDAVIYATCFALVIIIVAVIQNYNHLVERKRLFDKPAFTKLDFYGRIDGQGSIIKELETFLLGQVGDYYFRLNLIEPGQRSFKIEIVPLIDVGKDKALKAKLKKEQGLKEGLFFGLYLKPSKRDLENENYLLHKLTVLSETLAQLQVRQLDISDFELE